MIIMLIGLLCILIFLTVGSFMMLCKVVQAAFDEDFGYLLLAFFVFGVMLVFGGLTYQLWLEIAKYSLGR